MFFTLAAVASQTETECQPEWWDLTSSIALTEHSYSISHIKLKEVKKNWESKICREIIRENYSF